jgi:hypothetical protein
MLPLTGVRASARRTALTSAVSRPMQTLSGCARAAIGVPFFNLWRVQMTTSNDVRPGARLTDAQRRALTADLKKEFWQNVRGQCQGRQWPGKLQAWDVSPEGRVLAGIQTPQALIWMDAGPQPAVSQEDLACRPCWPTVRHATRPGAAPASPSAGGGVSDRTRHPAAQPAAGDGENAGSPELARRLSQ